MAISVLTLSSLLSTYQLTLRDFRYKGSVVSNTEATAEFTCPTSVWLTAHNALVGQSLEINPYLAIAEIDMTYTGQDYFSGVATLNCHFVPIFAVEAWTVGLPFKVRADVGGESFTVRGSTLAWLDGSLVMNSQVMPVEHYGVQNLVLFGARASFDGSSYASYESTVNSDTQLGADAGSLRFITASGNPKQICTGAIIYQVEVHIARRKRDWNQFWNETKSDWDYLAVNRYTPTAYAGLLT